MKDRPFTIMDTGINECPTSFVEPETLELVQFFARSFIMKEATGASPYGGDLNKYPARLADAFVILQNEHAKVENLRMKAK
jgi:hypothetical protein